MSQHRPWTSACCQMTTWFLDINLGLGHIRATDSHMTHSIVVTGHMVVLWRGPIYKEDSSLSRAFIFITSRVISHPGSSLRSLSCGLSLIIQLTPLGNIIQSTPLGNDRMHHQPQFTLSHTCHHSHVTSSASLHIPPTAHSCITPSLLSAQIGTCWTCCVCQSGLLQG